MNLFRHFRVTYAAAVLAIATFAMVGSASATSANMDVTDLWWNPNKSGNGYQMVNTGTFMFGGLRVPLCPGSPALLNRIPQIRCGRESL